MYAKDFSKKQVASFELHGRLGDKKIISAPYGYTINKKENRLEINPETAPIVQLIFRWFVSGTGQSEIVHRLNDFHVKAPIAYKDGRGEGLWNKNSLNRILENEAYIGNLIFGKSRSASYKGIKQHYTPREEWFIHENVHEPLITREQFEEAARIISENSKTVAAKKAGGVSKCTDRFHHKIKCRECGRTMMYWPKYNHTEFMTAEYKCYSAGKAGDTSTGSEVRRVGKKYNGSLKSDGTRRDCGKRVHEGFVRIVALDSIHSLFCTVADLKKMVSVIERNGGIIEKLNHEKIELHEKLHKTQKLIETTYMDFTSEILSYEEYIQLKEHYISEEIQRVDYEIQRIRNKVRDFLKWAESIDSEWFDNSETEQKLIDELISEIYITDNLEVEIVFHCDDIIAEINSLQEENV